ncbi:MAG TPA: MarR family transcriptional regulator [Sphingomonas sp.]
MNAIATDMLRYSAMSAPAVLAFADDAARGCRFARVVEAAGGRLVADGPLADAAPRIDRQVGPDALILIDVGADGGGLLDDVLGRIDAGVRLGRFMAIIVTSRPIMDIVVARIADPAAIILVDPSEQELAEAVSRALGPVAAMLWESSGESSGRRLAKLSEEVGRIARALAVLSGGEDIATTMPSPALPPPIVSNDRALSDLTVVRMVLRLRRLRDQFLQPALFADPAWDMLLDLMVAQLERRRVAVSSLCIAAAVPPTTALRWISTMTEQGLLARRPDPDDGRRIFIALSEETSGAMAGYIQAARRMLALAA